MKILVRHRHGKFPSQYLDRDDYTAADLARFVWDMFIERSQYVGIGRKLYDIDGVEADEEGNFSVNEDYLLVDLDNPQDAYYPEKSNYEYILEK